jgi:hypothetical protein
MVGAIKILWLFLLVASAVGQLLISERMFSVFNMEYGEVMVNATVPIVFFVSFWNTAKALWK